MSEELVLLNNDDFDPNDKLIWERPMTLALIQEYKRFEPSFQDPSVRKKLIWKSVAARLHARGYRNVTDDACDKKWRNLKKTFKDIYTGQRRKSNGKWAYYDILKGILEKDPKIINALVAEQAAYGTHADTLHALTKQPVIHKYKTADGQNLHVEVVDIGEMPQMLEDQDSESTRVGGGEDDNIPVQIICDEYEESPIIADTQQETQPPIWFSDFLNEYRADEERRIELLQSMHAEVITMENRKLDLLERLLEKLSPPNIENIETRNEDYSGL